MPRLAAFLALSVPLFASVAQAADPTVPQCLEASEASIRLRGEHKLKAARDALLVCSNAACPPDVQTECARRVDSVTAALPTLVLAARDAAGNDLSKVKVSMDGAPIADRLDGSAMTIDPGEHVFRFEAEGKPALERTFVVREGEKERHEIVVLGPAAPQGASAGGVDVTQESAPSDGKVQRIAAIASAGVAATGLALGAIFGLSASSHWSTAQSDCGASCAPNNPGVGERSTALTDAAVSTVGFVTAGVGLGAAALLWFTAPHAKPAAVPLGVVPQVGPGGGSLSLTGRF